MDKDNYKIIKNPQPLSSEQIKQHQDFDALLKQVTTNPDSATDTPSTAQPAIRRWLYPALALAAAAIVGFVMLVLNPTDQNLNTRPNAKAYFASQPFINPPIKTIKPVYATNEIDANQGGLYVHETGSKVKIPANAFVNGQGNMVEGPVEIKYREFHDYVDFFVSGIPMAYDSAGVEYQLESAGMIEVYAEQNGERLSLNPGKKLEVELIHDIYAKPDDPLDFNIYFLDENARNWDYRGKNKLTVLPSENQPKLSSPKTEAEDNYQHQIQLIEKEEATKLAAIEKAHPTPAKPVAPVRENENGHVFNLEFTESMMDLGNANNSLDQQRAALRELQEQYAKSLWQVAPNQPDFNEKAASTIQWQDMKLKKMNERDFELTLIGSQNEMKVIVNPVLSGSDYQAAMNRFNQEFAAYKSKLAEQTSKVEAERTALLNEIADRKRMAKMALDKRLETLKAEGKDRLVTEELIKHRVVNSFEATSLGIWNCDRPLPPCLVKLEADFQNEEKESFMSNVAFLADKSRNTVARFYAKKGTEVQYYQNSKKLLWVVTKDNKLAIYRPEKFENIEKKKKTHTFVLDIIDKKIETEENIREILLF